MEKRGWIESEWGQSENKRKAKFYQLTPAGRKQLKTASEEWSRYAEAIFKVLQAKEGEVAP
jgi:DNA-binding PadR family transcriptional regulator